MSQISSNIPITDPPTWAVWERRLLKAMDQSVYPFLDHFTGDNDEFIWKDELDNLVTVHHKDVVFDDLDLQGDAVINCSCEHMFDMSLIVRQYPDKLYIIKRNNNRNIKWLHINCAEDQGVLANQADLRQIHFGESKEMYGQKRIMIIGEHKKGQNVDKSTS